MTGWKKNMRTIWYESKRNMIENWHPTLSLHRQTKLLNISRSFLYYEQQDASTNETLMEEIDKIYTQYPFYWARRIREELKLLWYKDVTRYQVRELMKVMSIEAIYPKPKTSIPNKEHKVYPYLLKDVKITKVNQVWSTDITYIKLKQGWVYMMAVIDWYSRKIISWKISNTMDVNFCIEVLQNALNKGTPEIFNTDQWSQFTSIKFTRILEDKWIHISMDWVRRCLDNIYIERFWRTLKYEDIYINKYETFQEAQAWIKQYIDFYNHKRVHQSLDYQFPEQIWLEWENILLTFPYSSIHDKWKLSIS